MLYTCNLRLWTRLLPRGKRAHDRVIGDKLYKEKKPFISVSDARVRIRTLSKDSRRPTKTYCSTVRGKSQLIEMIDAIACLETYGCMDYGYEDGGIFLFLHSVTNLNTVSVFRWAVSSQVELKEI